MGCGPWWRQGAGVRISPRADTRAGAAGARSLETPACFPVGPRSEVAGAVWSRSVLDLASRGRAPRGPCRCGVEARGGRKCASSGKPCAARAWEAAPPRFGAVPDVFYPATSRLCPILSTKRSGVGVHVELVTSPPRGCGPSSETWAPGLAVAGVVGTLAFSAPKWPGPGAQDWGRGFIATCLDRAGQVSQPLLA